MNPQPSDIERKLAVPLALEQSIAGHEVRSSEPGEPVHVAEVLKDICRLLFIEAAP